MSEKFIALYEGLLLSHIDLGFQRTLPVLNKVSVCELRGPVLPCQQKLPQAKCDYVPIALI